MSLKKGARGVVSETVRRLVSRLKSCFKLKAADDDLSCARENESPAVDMLSEFPPEIQLIILQKLNLMELRRFRAVCRAWRSIASSVSKQPGFRPQQVPCLVTQASLYLDGLFTLSNQKLYNLELHELHNLVSTIHGSNFLLNPLTRRRIHMPWRPSIGKAVLLPHPSVRPASIWQAGASSSFLINDEDTLCFPVLYPGGFLH